MTTQPYSPMFVLRLLEREGVKLSVRDGKLYGSKFSQQWQRDLVKEYKVGLLCVLTHQCHVCNQPIRVLESDRVLAIECVTTPLHYFERINKFPGKRMRIFTDYETPPNCEECGRSNTNDMKHCDPCWLRAIEGE
jgi:hypothetical protein